jgi:hypothetical protein
VFVPCHRINKLGTHAYHRDRSAAAAIFANGTYFLDNPRVCVCVCVCVCACVRACVRVCVCSWWVMLWGSSLCKARSLCISLHLVLTQYTFPFFLPLWIKTSSCTCVIFKQYFVLYYSLFSFIELCWSLLYCHFLPLKPRALNQLVQFWCPAQSS